MAEELAQLRRENEALRKEVAQLHRLLGDRLDRSGTSGKNVEPRCVHAPVCNGEDECNRNDAAARPNANEDVAKTVKHHALSNEDVMRYSRQLILPSFGVDCQERLRKGSVLVVGAGGLGSPCALYLAASGLGRLGIADKDTVDLSNLHRQVIHTEARTGVHKTDSAASTCLALNSSLHIQLHRTGLCGANALDIIQDYDVVVDASDNAATRYLVSDCCALLRKPLVSGAALGMEGQLAVYCEQSSSPCYRCVHPVCPAPESCSRCADAGVLGVVPGVIGTLQALQAVHLLSRGTTKMAGQLMLFDAIASRFMTIRLRSRREDCIACGSSPSITCQSLPSYDYHAFTGQAMHDAALEQLQLLPREHRLSPHELRDRLAAGQRHMLLDVRPQVEFQLGWLHGSRNVPIGDLDKFLPQIKQWLRGEKQHGAESECHLGQGSCKEGGPMPGVEDESEQEPSLPLLVVCRRGNDSQIAVQKLREAGLADALDLMGGLQAWSSEIDSAMPLY